MASEGGETSHPLIRALEEEPYGFTFFQAIRMLEQAHPDTVPVGEAGPASAEVVRLRPTSSLDFPTADVTWVNRRSGEGPPFELETPIFGLYGPTSPLPSFYSEDILRRELLGESDPVRLFLDVMNHRLLALLYRAWSKYRWQFTFQPGATDRTSSYLFGLVGLATDGLRERVGLPAGRLLRYAGFLSQKPRGAVFLAGVVSDYFDNVPAVLEQCVLRWVDVPVEDQNRIGAANTTLSRDLIVGERVRDRTGKCRLALGPMEYAQYDAFLPSGRFHEPLGSLVRFLLPDPLVWDLRLVIKGTEVPMFRVSMGQEAARLGWTSWVRHDLVSPDEGEIFPAPPTPGAERA
jgi:type VI secretion system protein ImpH